MEEVEDLAARGVREMNLVAQDTSRYGLDIYGEYKLPELIHKVCAVEGVHWVRILYCYPDRITDELIAAMAAVWMRAAALGTKPSMDERNRQAHPPRVALQGRGRPLYWFRQHAPGQILGGILRLWHVLPVLTFPVKSA